MSSRAPSPNSSPIVDPPTSPSNSSQTIPPPSGSQPNQTQDSPPPSSPSTPTPSAPSPRSTPPPAQPNAPPPSPPLSPPPVDAPPPSSPPPSPPASPPPSPPSTSPSPPSSPPPSPPTLAPPTVDSPPPPVSSPSPPSGGSPPKASPAPPVETPPSPPAVSPSPPPPVKRPPSSHSPPPSAVNPPQDPPPPPVLVPPPAGSPPAPPAGSPPAPPVGTPPASPELPPPPVPSSSSPPLPSTSPPAPPTNSTVIGTSPPSPVPHSPTEKPTARSATPGPPSLNADTTSRDGGGNKAGVVAVGVVLGFLVLSLVVFAVWFTRKRKRKQPAFNLAYTVPSPYASSQNSESSFLRPQHSGQMAGSASTNSFMYSPESAGIGNSRSWFTYGELAEATDGFCKDNLLGEGGFGCVYKGILADGKVVAVKQLNSGGGQGEREFRAEVEIISRIHHRHLVSLVGYCISEQQRLLVYEFVPNDTLHYHLHDESLPVLDWATRVRIAAGAARGLAYLHEDCSPRIIHRDIKSSNILLDVNFDARVADFGLAKLAGDLDTHTHVSTRVMGTFGYLAPEYAASGKLTEKSDVYSFGVVLLELITGRKPVDASRPLGDESLVEWARPLLAQALDHENFDELVDPRLDKNYVAGEMFRMIEAAAACVRHLASKRPRMSQVVRALDSIDEISDLTNGIKPGQSGIYDSREHSAQIRMFQRMAFGSQEYSSDFFNYSHSGQRSL